MKAVFASIILVFSSLSAEATLISFDFATKSVPLDATLIHGSHGAPATSEAQRGVLLSSATGLINDTSTDDTQVAKIVLDAIDRR